ncbi:RNA polymerase sigma factor [Pontiella sulfatireligans]|uniref:ECF RNA polymerase sigma factor SigW n=1 Tax=Pontiella sulfatireligans TaxID=2750658 RepID=A0A6C2UHL5_9BACT|nr:sigma-70 family RNA polymerase sigma factor [Pontiella sulfatireligans]VGO18696.1 ECF RNA polymerase sigma factor SigW [Pontiella sulfatireligans]
MSDQYNTRYTLIQRVQENQDEHSWEEFLQAYQPYIQAIIRNMNINEHDAEDIVQQVMLKVWKKIGEIDNDPNKRFRSWLSTVTSNCVKDFIRKRKQDVARLEKAAQDETLSYINSIRLPDIEEIAERRWGVHVFNLALERIDGLFSGKAIQVFMLSLEGMPVDVIAQRMELKENSVYRLKNRVKERLALEIKQLREELE